MYIRHQALLVAHVIIFRLGTVKMFQALHAQSTVFLGAFHYAKDSGNFGRNSNGKVRFGFS